MVLFATDPPVNQEGRLMECPLIASPSALIGNIFSMSLLFPPQQRRSERWKKLTCVTSAGATGIEPQSIFTQALGMK